MKYSCTHHSLPVLLEHSLGAGMQHQWPDTAHSLILVNFSCILPYEPFFPCQYEATLTYGLRYYAPSGLVGAAEKDLRFFPRGLP